jgi:hypothetical protein
VVIERLCASGWSSRPFFCLRLDEADSSLINLLLALDAVAVLRLRSGRISAVSHQRGIGWIVSESERTGQARDEG